MIGKYNGMERKLLAYDLAFPSITRAFAVIVCRQVLSCFFAFALCCPAVGVLLNHLLL